MLAACCSNRIQREGHHCCTTSPALLTSDQSSCKLQCGPGAGMLAMVGWVGLLLSKDEPLGSVIARTFLFLQFVLDFQSHVSKLN